MRRPNVRSLICLVLLAPVTVWTAEDHGLQKRQTTTTAVFPTLTSIEGVSSASATSLTYSSTNAPAGTASSSSPSVSPSPTSASSRLSSVLPESSTSQGLNSTSSHSTSTTAATSTTASPTTGANSTATVDNDKQNVLPLKPRITPALSVGGVILILTGVLYALVGVKNRWIQIFLSTAYLTSLSITVLVDYVMSPPVSNAIQGAYFIGIFMTGVIFGAGALIFKEVTEGLGCLFGGFCLSMWFLTLKSGGLIASSTGKGIFVAIFCALSWSLSFSHYTRAYGLIVSTSFGGSTAFMIGIDCFSRAGLKEFWFYIWNLNGNLFPLNTDTYPITRGIRVETIAILLGFAIGVMSQIKLWKVVRDKQRRKDVTRLEDERRKNVVEEALGRHLERQNDRDRAHWEKQYGNRLQSKRTTILWSEAHPDKRFSQISSVDIKAPSQGSSSSESLEMSAFGPRRPPLAYGTKNKRTSTATVGVIPEEQEDQDTKASQDRLQALAALEKSRSSTDAEKVSEGEPDSPQSRDRAPAITPLPFKIPLENSGSQSEKEPVVDAKFMDKLAEPKNRSKRRSLQSLLSLSPRLSTEQASFSESQEALTIPEPLQHSRASSVAATLDEENEQLETGSLGKVSSKESPPPKIVITPVGSHENLKKELHQPLYDIRDVPPSPPALSINFDFDPEELERPLQGVSGKEELREDRRTSKEKTLEPLTDGVKPASEGYPASQISTGQSSSTDGLTKGALDQVPSQVSNVVLSYRTNEWAKHISGADAPVFDEPQSIEGVVDEAPVQLAPRSPTSPTFSSGRQSLDSTQTLTAISKPPPPHVITAAADGGITANPRPLQRSSTDQPISTTASAGPSRPTSTQLNKSGFSKPRRSSLNALQAKQSLATTPIDENNPTEFPTPQLPERGSTVGLPSRVQSTASLARSNGHGALGSSNLYESPNTSTYPANSRVSLIDPKLTRSSSAMSNRLAMRSESRLTDTKALPERSSSALSYRPGMRSDTRLDSYESRQPQQREFDKETARRETLLAEWRLSQLQGVNTNVIPKANVETRRAQMMLDKEHKKLMDEQQRTAQQQKQFAIDQVMRRPDMQDLHREAMRKLQASANKKL